VTNPAIPNKSVPVNHFSKNAAAMMKSAVEIIVRSIPPRNFRAITARMIKPMKMMIESAIFLKLITAYLIVGVYSKLYSNMLKDYPKK